MRVVVKVGGSLMKSGVPDALLDDLAAESSRSQMVVVHGGGDVVTETAAKLGKEQRFIVSPGGMRSRYTDEETAKIYTMVMSGLLAKRLVLSLASRGVKAVSLSGLDGGLIEGRRKERLAVVDDRGRKLMIDGGYTGKVGSVNAGLLGLLLDAGYTPVVSPVALGAGGVPLNIDGDKAAGAVASALKADAVIFATDVDGLNVGGSLVLSATADEAAAMLPGIGFGMQKKVMAAVEAVRSGVGAAIICSGTREQPLARALARKGCTAIC
jgi:acetylglutamate/LysW-gamma-L-alpha-aminoadipate kinase